MIREATNRSPFEEPPRPARPEKFAPNKSGRPPLIDTGELRDSIVYRVQCDCGPVIGPALAGQLEQTDPGRELLDLFDRLGIRRIG